MPKKPLKNSAQLAAIQRRRHDAIELRLAGLDNITIGKKLAADPSVNMDGVAYPMGYGNERYETGKDAPTDYDFSRLVSEDLRRALAERTVQADKAVGEIRDVETQRLDRMHLVAWRQALQGDLAAMDRVLKIQERRARLLGLDAATSMRLAGADGGALRVSVDELENLIRDHLADPQNPTPGD
jgi:hypothetical protein